MTYKSAEQLFDESHVLLEQGEYERAIEGFDEVIRLCPEMEGAWGNRGFARYETGRDQEALDDFEMVIRINPKDAFGHGFQSLTLRNLGRYHDALDAAARAIELADSREDVPPARLARGWLFVRSGQYAAACEDLARYLEFSNDGCVEALYEICRHVEETGERFCEWGPEGKLLCGQCQCTRCGYSFNVAANRNFLSEEGRCMFSHCIMTMPHRNGNGPGICPVFGHDCPGGPEIVALCPEEPEEESYMDGEDVFDPWHDGDTDWDTDDCGDGWDEPGGNFGI